MGGSPQLGREPGETEQEFNIRLQAEIRRLSTLLIDQGDHRITKLLRKKEIVNLFASCPHSQHGVRILSPHASERGRPE